LPVAIIERQLTGNPRLSGPALTGELAMSIMQRTPVAHEQASIGYSDDFTPWSDSVLFGHIIPLRLN
jgi:hypothetical protein